MKKITSIFCLFILMFLSFPNLAEADLGVGYEALTIAPHAFTIYYRNKDVGWGGKISADFSASVLSSSVRAFEALSNPVFGFYGYDIVNFFTLSATKDFSQDEIMRTYLKFGGVVIQGTLLGQTKTVIVPSAGYGWEWHEGLFGMLTSSIELGFPEICTLGFRHYF